MLPALQDESTSATNPGQAARHWTTVIELANHFKATFLCWSSAWMVTVWQTPQRLEHLADRPAGGALQRVARAAKTTRRWALMDSRFWWWIGYADLGVTPDLGAVCPGLTEVLS
jgi:hypothetical protein